MATDGKNFGRRSGALALGSGAALALAAAALVAALGARPRPVTVDASPWAELRARVVTLRDRVDDLEFGRAAAPSGRSRSLVRLSDEARTHDAATIAARLDEVQARLGVGAISIAWNGGLAIDPVDLHASIRRHHTVASRADAHPAERAEALEALHSLDPGAIDRPLAQEMLARARRSADPKLRRELLDALRRRPFAEVGSAATDFLFYDDDRRVREAAAGVLASRAGSDIGARRALEYARDHDPSPHVRRRASVALREQR